MAFIRDEDGLPKFGTRLHELMEGDETWAGGIKTGSPCSGCGKSPSRGSRWSFYCVVHGGACGECKRRNGPICCPVPHEIFHATATRDGEYWLVHVAELGQYTQAHTLAEVAPMARELISLVLDVPADTFRVVVSEPT